MLSDISQELQSCNCNINLEKLRLIFQFVLIHYSTWNLLYKETAFTDIMEV